METDAPFPRAESSAGSWAAVILIAAFSSPSMNIDLIPAGRQIAYMLHVSGRSGSFIV